MTTINMIGKPCPIPVVETKKALSQPGVEGVIVLVDNNIAVQNLSKMANGLGYSFSHEQKDETEYAVTILKGDADGKPLAVSQPETCSPVSGAVVFLITGDQIGISAEEPGKNLMKTFLYSLAQLPNAPGIVLLINAGVKLACEGSEVLENLRTLAGNGTDIRSCGMCLKYYNLTEKLTVGTITNMMEIVEILTGSARVITL
jgi:selenium metabolism protein YedF